MSTAARVDIQRESNGAVRAWFVCPGCGHNHAPAIEASSGPVWGFNGNVARPTFTPSLNVKSGHYADGTPASECWLCKKGSPACFICHSFITDGRIQFLSDCTHALAGQTVDLPELAS